MDPNFESNEKGINLQAMDNSHVALVAVKIFVMASWRDFDKYYQSLEVCEG